MTLSACPQTPSKSWQRQAGFKKNKVGKLSRMKDIQELYTVLALLLFGTGNIKGTPTNTVCPREVKWKNF